MLFRSQANVHFGVIKQAKSVYNLLQKQREKIIKVLQSEKKDDDKKERIQKIIESFNKKIQELPYEQKQKVKKEFLSFLKMKNLVDVKSETEDDSRKLSFRML